MLAKFPKDDKYFAWTRHVKNKMLFYGLSAERLRRIVRSPKRTKHGVAERTIAVMQPNHTKTRREEIWVMYLRRSASGGGRSSDPKRHGRLLIISAWRYPGVSKPEEKIPIPTDIEEELAELER